MCFLLFSCGSSCVVDSFGVIRETNLICIVDFIIKELKENHCHMGYIGSELGMHGLILLILSLMIYNQWLENDLDILTSLLDVFFHDTSTSNDSHELHHAPCYSIIINM